MMKLARAAWERADHATALDLFEKAVREQPRNVLALVKAARAYAEKFELERVEILLNQLRKLGPDNPGVHHYIGETYALMRMPDKARAAYEKACTLPGVQAVSLVELAAAYERSHRIEEASETIERAVQSGLRHPLLHLTRARVQRRNKQAEAAEQTLRALIERLNPDDEWACQAWAELALMRDKAGDYDEAWQAITQCKAGQARRSSAENEASEKILKRFRQMMDNISVEHFTRWKDGASALTPVRTAVLTGFPRSGTTLLEQVLDAHPDLVSSEERDFLGKEQFVSMQNAENRQGPILEALDAVPVNQIAQERKRYFHVMEHLLGDSINGRMHLDKNPAYNQFIPVVFRLFPEVRLITALRDPRDVILSCYLRYLPMNPVSVSFLTIKKTAERYALDMAAWLKLREVIPSPWCEVRYEDTVADIETQARRALKVLDLPWDSKVLKYRERLGTQRQVNSPTYEAVTKPIYSTSIGRWKNYQKFLEPVMPSLEPFIKAFGYA